MVEIIGKGIVYFSLFYTSANWWLYRRTREDLEKAEEEAKKKREEKNAKTPNPPRKYNP